MNGSNTFYNLSNGIIDVVIADYGCTIVAVHVPDCNGIKKNIVAGFSEPERYFGNHPYFGSSIGRFANRIAFGKFSINNKEYQLPVNDGINHLHGGTTAFDKKFWKKEN